MYLVFDFETTGISDNLNPIHTQRAIQLAWQELDTNTSPIASKSYYISGNPHINTNFHTNLSVEFLDTHGSDVKSVLAEFMNDLKTVAEHSGVLVAHNIDFDFTVLTNELNYTDLQQDQQYQQLLGYFSHPENKYCTMKRSVDFCKLPKHSNSVSYGSRKRQHLGYKWPRTCRII